MMDERVDVIKANFNELLCGIVNEKLALEGGSDGCTLRVEDVDVGVLIYPDDILEESLDELFEEIAFPVYMVDLTSNASLLVDMRIQEVTRGLFSRVLMQIYITEKRDVEVNNADIYETEILAQDLEASNRWSAYELMLEKQTSKIARVTKGAFEHIMREKTAEDDLDALMITRG